jgi:hypothetical protein
MICKSVGICSAVIIMNDTKKLFIAAIEDKRSFESELGFELNNVVIFVLENSKSILVKNTFDINII